VQDAPSKARVQYFFTGAAPDFENGTDPFYAWEVEKSYFI
jgi:hypothetical protein